MQRFGVSRGVVREALSRLAAAGLVQTQHGIGSFALAPDARDPFRITGPVTIDLADMLDMLELRTSVESDAAGLAAMRRSDRHLAAMRQALDDFTAHLTRVGETVSPDFRFHLAIAEATGNRYYAELMGQLGLAVIPSTRVSSARLGAEYREQHLQKVNQEHHDIFAAIVRRDPEAARAAMRIHLVNSRERQREAATPPS
jgi:GntR family transcriptional regulator, transcriptional repressor for pyruvate dehydrogenase complex